jgi:hypothetical protein
LLSVLVIVQGVIAASFADVGNSSAFKLQTADLHTSPFRLYDDRPDDCPPWYQSIEGIRCLSGLVSTVCCRCLSASTALRATSSTASVNVPLALGETTAWLRVLPKVRHDTNMEPAIPLRMERIDMFAHLINSHVNAKRAGAE